MATNSAYLRFPYTFMVHSAATCWYSSYACGFLPSICDIDTATHAHFLNMSYSCFCNHYDVNNGPHNSSVVMTGAQALMTYPAGSGPIYLDNVACSGSELTLVQCPYNTHTGDCEHREDAGVRCIRKYIIHGYHKYYLELLIGYNLTLCCG